MACTPLGTHTGCSGLSPLPVSAAPCPPIPCSTPHSPAPHTGVSTSCFLPPSSYCPCCSKAFFSFTRPHMASRRLHCPRKPSLTRLAPVRLGSWKLLSSIPALGWRPVEGSVVSVAWVLPGSGWAHLCCPCQGVQALPADCSEGVLAGRIASVRDSVPLRPVGGGESRAPSFYLTVVDGTGEPSGQTRRGRGRSPGGEPGAVVGQPSPAPRGTPAGLCRSGCHDHELAAASGSLVPCRIC